MRTALRLALEFCVAVLLLAGATIVLMPVLPAKVQIEMTARFNSVCAAVCAAAGSPQQSPLPLYVRATFRPVITSDLRYPRPAVGMRDVWQSTWIINAGPHKGQRAWYSASGGGVVWVPECDLADWEPATYRDFNAAIHVDVAP